MNIKVQKLYDYSECELGCSNDAEGYNIIIDGVEYDDLTPHASCCSSSSFNEGDLLKLIMSKMGRPDIKIDFED
ncbi:Hypothetical protein KNT65_gp088 [Escherichia phage EcS1]|uniref:Uncharacterized protein n=1 Tax=Escherichia phage EcS1 TaxID=2083276 RepID=A0A2Z5ZCE3_9CAUD|nr:Hypothetical protein KNT65_gp088 [Escherichia phage EcS1]BBC78136.1 Hypothetical protein [Escherichia phage EcS1]